MVAGQHVTPTIKLVRLLGKGGMGAVWAAEHLALGTHVAVKLMAPGYADDEMSVLRFRQEAQAAAGIKSPHVTTVFDHGVTAENQPYIVMEMLEGETLREFMAKRHQLGAQMTLAEVVNLVVQTAQGLDAAHKLRVWHRDIKPDNLFVIDVGGKPFIKIVDFGLAKRADEDLAMTSTGKAMGTPLYMSPEQFNDTKRVDLRTDLWSLGVVAYEALAGARPFTGNSFWELAFAVHKGSFQAIHTQRPDLPKSVDAWMTRVLSPDPDARFGSAMEMAEALVTVLHEPKSGQNPPLIPNTGLTMTVAPTVPFVVNEKPPQPKPDEAIRNLFDKPQREHAKPHIVAPGESKLEIVTDPDRGGLSLSLHGTSSQTIAFDVGASIFIAFATGDVFCADVMTGHTRWWRRLIGRPISVCSGAGLLALGGSDGNINVLDQATGRLAVSLKTANVGGIRAVAINRADKTLATTERGRRIAIWSLATGGQLQLSEEHSGEPLALAFNQSRGYWVSGGRESAIRVWDISLRPVHVLRGPRVGVRCLAFAPSGSHFAAGYGDGTIAVCDGQRWEIAKILEGHTERVHSMVFLRDSNTLISGAADGTQRIWDVARGKSALVDGTKTAAIECVAVSPNNSHIASASADGKVRVYRWPLDPRLVDSCVK